MDLNISSSTTLPQIIGLPPTTQFNNTLVNMTMPVMEIIPCDPDFSEGLTLFKLKNNWEKYSQLLTAHGYTSGTSGSLKVAFTIDSLPSDTFTNEYGESFLNKLTDLASSGAGELSQIMGKRKLTENLAALSSKAKDSGSVLGQFAGSGLDMANAGIEEIKSVFGNGNMGNVMDSVLSGARVDFPQVWKNSSYQPSYSFNIRLYNPNPGNATATKKYIVGPLAALLLLGMPITEDGDTLNWPFFHKIKCKGLFRMIPGCISGITVTKGGDQQLVGFNQRLGMVDVRIEVTNLFRSMIAGLNYSSPEDRPTLLNYLQNMSDESRVVYDVDNPNTKKSVSGSGESSTDSTLKSGTSSTQTTQTTDNYGDITNRVSTSVTDAANNLYSSGKNLYNDLTEYSKPYVSQAEETYNNLETQASQLISSSSTAQTTIQAYKDATTKIKDFYNSLKF